MATQLPRDTRLTLQQALDRYLEWRGMAAEAGRPKVIRQLGDGSNNHSFLVSNRREYVVRVRHCLPGRNRLEPGAETEALARAAAVGLAPEIRFSDDEAGVLVCDYLAPDPDQGVSPGQLAALLRGIHGLEAVPYVVSLADRIRHYEHLVAPSGNGSILASFSGLAMACAKDLQSGDREPVLCHNDLLPPNLVRSGDRLWAIDWEYAGMGNCWFDLAGVACGHGLESADRLTLLRTYLGRDPQPLDLADFQRAALVYRYLESLWYATHLEAFDARSATLLLEKEAKRFPG